MTNRTNGVEEDGTGIEKDGTGWHRGRWRRTLAFAAIGLLAGMTSAQADEAYKGLIASIHGGAVMLSFHTPGGTVAGSVKVDDASDTYHQVLLFSSEGSGDNVSILVQGSGTGTSSTEPCEDEFSILVQGSGTGSSSVGDGCTFDNPNVWGLAEVEQVGDGVNVTIHRVLDGEVSLFASVLLAL